MSALLAAASGWLTGGNRKSGRSKPACSDDAGAGGHTKAESVMGEVLFCCQSSSICAVSHGISQLLLCQNGVVILHRVRKVSIEQVSKVDVSGKHVHESIRSSDISSCL